MNQLEDLQPGQAQVLSYLKPALPVGKYTVDVEQIVTAPTTTSAPDSVTLQTTKLLHVQGPSPYQLPAGSLQSFYPSQGEAVGFRILPHIVFSNPHVPWELSPDHDDAVGNEYLGEAPVPWLALLVFTADELNVLPSASPTLTPSTTLAVALSKKQLQDLRASSQSPKIQVPISDDKLNESPDSNVNAIFVNSAAFRAYFAAQAPNTEEKEPAISRFAYLSHVRRSQSTKVQPLQQPPTETFGITLGHRAGPMDTTGSTTAYVHLVSLKGVQDLVLPQDGATDLTALISLFSWTFSWVPDTEAQVEQTMQLLSKNVRPLARTLPSSLDKPNPWVQTRVAAGHTFVNHHLPSGETTVALYRGPLIPQASPPDEILKAEPTTHSSSLQIVDVETGFVDISYSVAWDLGRSLGVQNSAFATAMSVLRAHLLSIYTRGQPPPAQSGKSGDPAPQVFPDWVQKLRQIVAGATQETSSTTTSTSAEAVSRWKTERATVDSLNAQPKIPVVQPQSGIEAVRKMLNDEITELINDEAWAGREASDPSQKGLFLPKIINFVYNELLTLQAIPQNYLFPEPDILETDAVFTFYLDPLWLDAVVDGALSVGNHGIVNDDVCKNEVKNCLNQYMKPIEKHHSTKRIPVWGVVLCGQFLRSFPNPQVFTGHKNTVPSPQLLRTTKLTDEALLLLFNCRPEDLAPTQAYGLTISQPPHQQRFAAGTTLTSTTIEIDFPGIALDNAADATTSPIVIPKLQLDGTSDVFDFTTRCLCPAQIMTNVASNGQGGSFPVAASSAFASLALSDKILELAIQPTTAQADHGRAHPLKPFQLYIPAAGSALLATPGEEDAGGSTLTTASGFSAAQTLGASSGSMPLGYQVAQGDSSSASATTGSTTSQQTSTSSPQILNFTNLRGAVASDATSPVTTTCRVLNQYQNADGTSTTDLLISIKATTGVTSADPSLLVQRVRLAFPLFALVDADSVTQPSVWLPGPGASGWSAGYAILPSWPPSGDEGAGDSKSSGPAFVVDLMAWCDTPAVEADIVALVSQIVLCGAISGDALLDVVEEFGTEDGQGKGAKPTKVLTTCSIDGLAQSP